MSSSIRELPGCLCPASASDCVVLVTDHCGIDYSRLVHLSPLIVDTRNRLRGLRDRHIIRL